jgi:ribosomal-protein-alanine N-acetyltransferase
MPIHVAPSYQGNGYATEAASALVDYAFNSDGVKTVRAHTLPEFNGSTRVLEKCGFKRIGEIVDLENNLVWRWERKRDASSASPYIDNHILKRSPR